MHYARSLTDYYYYYDVFECILFVFNRLFGSAQRRHRSRTGSNLVDGADLSYTSRNVFFRTISMTWCSSMSMYTVLRVIGEEYMLSPVSAGVCEANVG